MNLWFSFNKSLLVKEIIIWKIKPIMNTWENSNPFEGCSIMCCTASG
ncbi:hypothetical protein M9397_02990 [Blochmannia endosymbiont of Camponotus sp. C-003]|nr:MULTISPECIES: hypothetical protein [unclassified Candidatus Blochmannia]URJ23272.1 hypothetical protein M9397_02990 [Blochmannia endosymbiont of Camponotus sp. C-003]URJ28742.1 hypothetical protein M9409_03100 [Blochmannia endosymbiont of Camponotus sp. C-046]